MHPSRYCTHRCSRRIIWNCGTEDTHRSIHRHIHTHQQVGTFKFFSVIRCVQHTPRPNFARPALMRIATHLQRESVDVHDELDHLVVVVLLPYTNTKHNCSKFQFAVSQNHFAFLFKAAYPKQTDTLTKGNRQLFLASLFALRQKPIVLRNDEQKCGYFPRAVIDLRVAELSATDLWRRGRCGPCRCTTAPSRTLWARRRAGRLRAEVPPRASSRPAASVRREQNNYHSRRLAFIADHVWHWGC